jgi:glutamate--cysteine ligase
MSLHDRLRRLSPERLRGLRRGLEKESLRSLPDGGLALTPHPGALGAPLTHPHITTDFSESQLELITGVHAAVEGALDELTQVHQFVARTLAAQGDERLWVTSMPCALPTDETIPLGRYGTSNVARAKSVYRMGLGHRYGRRMQTISGLHYNWSLPGLDDDAYFALIRNFRRHAFLLLWLFGASPAVCGSFVAGREHGLVPLARAPDALPDLAPADGDETHLACTAPGTTLHLPHATSLRMGRLGYQSDAQARIALSCNSLERYAASLHAALTEPYAPYEAMGVRNLGGDYNQLATTLLQIENEFYGAIRPKRVIKPGERPLHALRERGVEYVEVRCMDLDPFEPAGIAPATVRFLDMFLLHCLLADSPPDTPEEIAALARNQHHVATHGREPGLVLERAGATVPLAGWAAELLDGMAPIAAALDGVTEGAPHAQALAAARAALAAPDTLPSARMLAAMRQQHGGSHIGFGRAQSARIHAQLMSLPWSDAQQRSFEAMARASVAERQRIEAADSMDFETYRQAYLAPERLQVRSRAMAVV